MTRLALMLALASLPMVAAAQSALPDEAAVRAALDGQPAVVAADARIAGARAEARGLRAGPHEVVIGGSYVSRSVAGEPRYNEFDASVSRAIRLPAKARLDRAAGEHGIAAAENRAEDARHQAALTLNMLWHQWVSDSVEARIDVEGAASYAATLAAVERRVALHDAPELEADQARAALGEARARAAQSQGRAHLARVRLSTRFPTLVLPDVAPEPGAPAVPDPGLAQMAEQVVARSHEIGAAEAEAARLASLSERVRRDRMPDPTIGLRLFSERDGAERGAGILFSMPLGGGARSASADRAAAEAVAGAAHLAQVRAEVSEMAGADVAEVETELATWQRTREMLDAQVAALQKLHRGYRLGAIDLADVLQAERLTQAAFRSEAVARVAAHRAINQLRIDSHNLWISE